MYTQGPWLLTTKPPAGRRTRGAKEPPGGLLGGSKRTSKTDCFFSLVLGTSKTSKHVRSYKGAMFFWKPAINP